MIVINDELFVHGGLSDKLAGQTLEQVNTSAIRDVRAFADGWHALIKGGAPERSAALLYLMAYDRLGRDEHVPGVVGTLMTNMAVEVALKSRGVQFVRAKVGDRYVLEELERLRIPVACVAGTSMGALVAGAWAAGLSPVLVAAGLQRFDTLPRA